jgi:hypothetical protein
MENLDFGILGMNVVDVASLKAQEHRCIRTKDEKCG